VRAGLELKSPHPIGESLPGLFQEDDFAQRFTSGLDGVLAPVFLTIDNFDAYLDPSITPEDFIEWLAQWVGMAIDENWPIARQRNLIRSAVDLYSRRGTKRGIAELIEIYTGFTPEIEDSGGVSTSEAPGAALPGGPEYKMTVTVTVPDPDSIDRGRLSALIGSAKPAHVNHELEVVKG
jgi:phage tail-like protein